MSNYVDAKNIESFTTQLTQGFTEAVEFAVQQRQNMGESSEEEERQAAQDALMELTTDVVEAMRQGYSKAGLWVDHPAIAAVFDKLAVRARLMQHLVEGDQVQLVTRKGTFRGELVGWSVKEGEQVVAIREGVTTHEVPEIAVLEISA